MTKFIMNEEDSTQDAAFEVLDEILEGDIYGWDNFLDRVIEESKNGRQCDF